MSHWSQSPQALNELAGQYVLGTLQGRARRRFETLMAQRPDVADRVADWESRLHRMAQALPPLAPAPAVWDRLAARAGLPVAPDRAASPIPMPGPGPETTPTPMPTPTLKAQVPGRDVPPGLLQRLARGLQALLAPVPAGALVFGLVAGLVIPQVYQALNPPPQSDTELPESYVGVLARPDGKPGLIVASLRHGRVVDLKQVSAVQPPAGQTLFLWVIDAQGQATPVGPVPSGPFVQAPLADTAEKVFSKAVELGVTLEALGSTPATPNTPAGVWVYRGLCGKV